MKACDNHVVGVLIHDAAGRLLMFQRATPPPGVAPPAGHVEHHGSADDAAVAEVREEVGLTVVRLRPLLSAWLPDSCGSRDLPGPQGFDHRWTVYRADVTGEVEADVREARHPYWYTPAEVQALTDRTVAYAHGRLSAEEFAAEPGLEPVWVGFLRDLGLVRVDTADLDLIARMAVRPPANL